MIQVMAVGMMVLVVQLLVEGGMVHTIALYSNRKGGVMSALTWWRPPAYTHHISRRGLQFMVTMYIFLRPKETK